MRLLIVEDEAVIRQQLEDYFAQLDFVINVAADGNEEIGRAHV